MSESKTMKTIYKYSERGRGLQRLDGFFLVMTKVRKSSVPGKWIMKCIHRFSWQHYITRPVVDIFGFSFTSPLAREEDKWDWLDDRFKEVAYSWRFRMEDEIEVETRDLEEMAPAVFDRMLKECQRISQLKNLEVGLLF